MKITKQQLENLVTDIARVKNLSCTKKSAIDNKDFVYLELDHNATYGGYMLVFVDVLTGGHFGAFGLSATTKRINAIQMFWYLTGILNSNNSPVSNF